MHKKDMVDAMLGKIEQAIIRILNNSQSIDSYHYYLITPAGMERLESTCMLLMAVGEGIKGVDKMTNKSSCSLSGNRLEGCHGNEGYYCPSLF